MSCCCQHIGSFLDTFSSFFFTSLHSFLFVRCNSYTLIKYFEIFALITVQLDIYGIYYLQERVWVVHCEDLNPNASTLLLVHNGFSANSEEYFSHCLKRYMDLQVSKVYYHHRIFLPYPF